ncbi:MAG: site-specific integrase [Clostridiales Family XIII bacterium]|nr:site-specific integrase [Clostridiales Family XIII bacterium]
MARKTFTFEGKRYFVRGRTQEEAIEKAALLKYDLKLGKVKITGDMRVSDWQTRYLEEYKRQAIGDYAYKVLMSISRVWVNPHIGHMRLSDVKQMHIQKIMNAMDGKSKNHINRTRFHLQSMFEKAIANGLASVNPCKGVSMPKATDGTHRALTEKERRTLLSVCETNSYGLWCLVMYYCGLRPGETESIKGMDIDLQSRILHVRGTKTAASDRTVCGTTTRHGFKRQASR